MEFFKSRILIDGQVRSRSRCSL